MGISVWAVRDRQGETHYYPIRCFGKLAASVTAIKKGAKVFVAGELEMGSFVGEDGQKQVLFRVIAETYRILGDGRQTDKTETASATAAYRAESANPSASTEEAV